MTKKRVADRQITKDDGDKDYDRVNNDDADPRDVVAVDPGTGMVKADRETLSKRRILKARRPGGSSSAAAAAAPAETTTNVDSEIKRNNPFASTVLVSSVVQEDGKGVSSVGSAGATTPTEIKEAPKPVFGVGFSGFQTAVKAPGTGAFGFVFGSAGAKGNTSGGFGVSASSAPFSFGSASNGATKAPAGAGDMLAPSTSLFSAPDAGSSTGFTFGMASSKPKIDVDADHSGNGDASTTANATANTTTTTTTFPEKVDLTTGEEKEKVLHIVRCKSFKWVPVVQTVTTPSTEGAKGTGPGSNDNGGADSSKAMSPSKPSVAHPSVPPSSHFNTTTGTASTASSPTLKQTNDESKEKRLEGDRDNGVYSDPKPTENAEGRSGKDDVEKDSKEPNGNGELEEFGQNEKDLQSNSVASVVATLKDDDEEPKFKWQEIGIGPLRILQEFVGKRNEKEKEQTEMERQAALFMAAFPANSNDKRIRLVQRRESVPNGKATKLLLNTPIWRESTVSNSSDKFIRLTTPDLETGHAALYLFKFKTALDAATFKSIIETAIEHLAKSCVGGAPEASAKVGE